MFKEEKGEVTTIEYVDFGTVLTMASSLEARTCEVCLTSVLVAGIRVFRYGSKGKSSPK